MEVNYERLYEILEEIGAEPKFKNDHLECKTVCHLGDSHKLYFYFDSNTFYCYTSCGNISLYDFLNQFNEKYYYEVTNSKKELNCDIGFKNIEVEIPQYFSYQDIPLLEEKNDEVLNQYKNWYYEGWNREFIKYSVMKNNNIKYDLAKNRIIMPHYDINNKLIGIRYRNLNNDNGAKYHPLDGYNFDTGKNLYGINKLNNYDPIILVEAEKSVMQLESYGITNGLALTGSNLTVDQVNLINKKNINSEIIIALDKEYERIGDQKYQLQIKKIKSKFLQKLKLGSRIISVIIDRKGMLQEKDSPTDRGKNIFEELYKERVVLK